MKKSALGLLFVVTSAISLVVGYKVGSHQKVKVETGQEIVARFSNNGQPTEIKLKDLSPFLSVDQTDYKKVVYVARSQAIQSYIAKTVRDREDMTRVDFEPVSAEEVLEMLKKMKLDPKKATDRQRQDVLANLTIAKRNQAINKKLETSVEKMNLEIYLQPPFDFVAVPKQSGFLVYEKGNKANVNLQWHGNFHCPQCAATFEKISDAIQMAPDKFRVQFSYYGQDPDASIAFQMAKGFYCLQDLKLVADPNSFFELMSQASKAPPQTVEAIVKLLGAGIEEREKALSSCLADRTNNAELRSDAEISAKIPGAQQTASFLILDNFFVQGSELKDLYLALVSWVLRVGNSKS